jgi:hypothetical protein
VTIILHPLLAKQTDIGSVDPAGADISAHGDVGTDGRFKLTFGAVSVPGTSNPISGSVIDVDGTAFEGVFYDTASMCGQLEGTATTPIDIDLNKGAGTPCITQSFTLASGTIPARQAADFVCPLP